MEEAEKYLTTTITLAREFFENIKKLSNPRGQGRLIDNTETYIHEAHGWMAQLALAASSDHPASTQFDIVRPRALADRQRVERLSLGSPLLGTLVCTYTITFMPGKELNVPGWYYPASWLAQISHSDEAKIRLIGTMNETSIGTGAVAEATPPQLWEYIKIDNPARSLWIMARHMSKFSDPANMTYVSLGHPERLPSNE